ncbi:4Fe-4S binding protein [Scatolibacter rhodanostii]|uniref:4Fe-4S binding protein n=1 Tax=Scatolibacter rhodanostii TaxID=2014781 RepID=UPI001FA8BCA8|nr:4Fe-4S binding protein [Scatolibacter rhodanostii]
MAKKNQLAKLFSRRNGIQAGWAFLTNANISGFFTGKIYNGKLKSLCVPGLNCYSCPGALGSCPIGSLQAVVGSFEYQLSFYLMGFFLLVGSLLGRFVCGFLCPFGFVQDLLHKIPFPKKIKTFRGDKSLRLLKYFILLVFVLLIPMFVVDAIGGGSPAFCKWICPAGMLEGGIPLVSSNPSLQSAVGFLFTWKLVILIVTILLSIIIYRPFCKYICPLGTIYALFNKISAYHYTVSKTTCISCGKCERECPMNIDPVKQCNHGECVRCGVCKTVCPTGAITSGFQFGSKEKSLDKRRISDIKAKN